MKVVLGQSDVVTAYGWGFEPLWSGLTSNQTAIRPTDRFVDRGFLTNLGAVVPGLDVLPDESRVMAMLRRLLSSLAGKLDPLTPIILATTVGEIEFIERSVLENSAPLVAQSNHQVLLERIKQLIGLRGPGMVLSSACASSSAAVARAASMVRHGDARSVLVVAADALSEFVYSGFSSLSSLCPQPAQPFDAGRCGLTLGEAAAWVIVASDEHPPAAGWTTRILGWGSTTDGHHMTAPDPTGAGLSRAIAKALAMADVDAGDISFIAAHGTATLYSDAMELLAFRAAMEEPTPVFSVKGGVGHTLGAAGLLQILVSQRSVTAGVVPPTVGMIVPDPNAVGWVFNAPAGLKVEPDAVPLGLSTNSGFGGVNTAIVLSGREPS